MKARKVKHVILQLIAICMYYATEVSVVVPEYAAKFS